MAAKDIYFFVEDTTFILKEKAKVRTWLQQAARLEAFKIDELNFIFCSDTYLLGINQQYLQHDYYTDIITFDTSEKSGYLRGDIFISMDRVLDNADTLHLPFEMELKRVLIHGVLHLMGYSDKTTAAKASMTAKEDFYLAI